ncbi:MAG: hypothetical protein WEA10_09905 [Actinomycetota bacterium]
METSDIRDLVHFAPDEPARHDLFETDHLWSEVVCLQETQRFGPVGDSNSDAIVVVLAGEVAAQVGKGRARIRQWGCAVVPAGDELTLANASGEPAVVLMIAAPPPRPGIAITPDG